jgi:hypothetical protein
MNLPVSRGLVSLLSLCQAPAQLQLAAVQEHGARTALKPETKPPKNKIIVPALGL